MAAQKPGFAFRSQFWAAAAQPEPEPEPEPEHPVTRNFIVLQGDGAKRPALALAVDELTLDDVEKDPSGNWTLAQYSGLMLWDAATIFARWMHRYAAEVFRGRSVLELGAGSTGLPGLTAHLLGARQVVLSDYIPELVGSLKANIRRCQQDPAAPAPGQIRAATLDWSAVASHGAGALGLGEDGGGEQFDAVIGSEVIYEEEHVAWVIDCLSAFVRPGGVVYMIASTRPERPGWVALKKALPSAGGGVFEVEVIPVQGEGEGGGEGGGGGGGGGGGMPSVLYEGLAEGSDFLHEMLSVRRRQKSPAAEAADDGGGGGRELAADQTQSSHEFPSLSETVSGPDPGPEASPDSEAEPELEPPAAMPAADAAAVESFLGAMPSFC